MLGPHCLRTWSATQGAVALSSCEAEYYAVVEGATRAIGVRTVAEELGILGADPVTDVVTVFTDSSAAKSLASRRGSGRVRHIETRWLWLQSAVAEGKVRMRKASGATNPADVLTKFQSRGDMSEKLLAVNVELEEKEAPRRRRLRWADAEDEERELAAGWGALCGSGGGRALDGTRRQSALLRQARASAATLAETLSARAPEKVRQLVASSQPLYCRVGAL